MWRTKGDRVPGSGDSKYKGPEVGMSLGICREKRCLLWLKPEGERVWKGEQWALPDLLQPRAQKTLVKSLNFILNSAESCQRVLIRIKMLLCV